jgi:hypothetical protein
VALGCRPQLSGQIAATIELKADSRIVRRLEEPASGPGRVEAGTWRACVEEQAHLRPGALFYNTNSTMVAHLDEQLRRHDDLARRANDLRSYL